MGRACRIRSASYDGYLRRSNHRPLAAAKRERPCCPAGTAWAQ
ncbi:hypothetical protein BIWAKO_00990 [Bosea sp. BIWAKO-01]|nr:hypothetical protein BIWAKO_00990 [Bosea sp. BIWAKO-01]